MLNETEKKDVRQRLKKVAGQINGIDKMVEEGRYCVDVVQQIVAARAALNKAAMLILESHAKSCVVKAIKEDNGEKSIDELMQVLKHFTKQYFLEMEFTQKNIRANGWDKGSDCCDGK